jgi:hypothetical protein
LPPWDRPHKAARRDGRHAQAVPRQAVATTVVDHGSVNGSPRPERLHTC